ncbi:hypothetical protein [Micromonospora sp. HM5-17]|jgi:hypothetical protein|uniref:hypothetical protein n=1 Tax=Micromonospora sp. HM5-17 TaxID=2487710 RepID=UPI000F4AD6D4|nr:hypothetical protein [Micromonospora sp. HM5-17]ROT32827.1 hypothetical protein EF879_06480 [Micromonospora sp. HM5-17]
MPTPQTHSDAPVRIAAHRGVTKRLGHWTTARAVEVRAHRGAAVLDLRSPRIPAGELRITVDLDRATLTLLVPDDAAIDDWDLHRVGRARVTDPERPDTPGDRRITLTGTLRNAEVRIRRRGLAVLTAMCSREYWVDLRRAHREGRPPTVVDPAHPG